MDFFDRQWSTYRRVVDHDLMEHRALTAATPRAINDWLATRPAGAPSAHMVDLGCGDLGLLTPVLRNLPLGSYLGLDLSAPVLPRAAALGPVSYPCQWRGQDLLAWTEAEPEPEPVDLLHSAFALHHLSDENKSKFLELCHRHLAPGGLLLWADVFREPGEAREAYVARYVDRIRSGWNPLEPEQQQQVIDHLSQFDDPADREAIQRSAEAGGGSGSGREPTTLKRWPCSPRYVEGYARAGSNATAAELQRFIPEHFRGEWIAALAGEGQTWLDLRRLLLSPDQSTLTDVTHAGGPDQDKPFVRKRCTQQG